MPWEIKHRYTGAVLASGSEAHIRDANLRGADLRGADLRGADLQNANLWGADLWDANLEGANLRIADLRNADLWDANLRNADLLDANLRGASLRGTNVIDCGQRSDGYQFFMQFGFDREPKVLAGCRYMRVSAARKHWQDTRGGTPLGEESQALIDHGLRLAEIRGLK